MPEDTVAARRRSTAALIVALTGVMTAVGAFIKSADHSVTKASYDELSTGLKKISDQTSQNHDDIVALRGYVAGLNGEVLLPSASVTPPPMPSATVSAVPIPFISQPRPSTSVTPLLRPDAGPPPVDRVFLKYEPPSFDRVYESAKK